MEIQSETPDWNSTEGRAQQMVAKKDAGSEAQGAEIERKIDWGKVDNLADARLLLEQNYGAVLSSQNVFGDGAEFIKEKDKLVGVPFLVLDWRENTDPATGNKYVNVLIMNATGSKARFNDGSTGVYAQLKKVHEEYGVIGIECRFGLRKSEYTIEVDGKPQKASTYYLA